MIFYSGILRNGNQVFMPPHRCTNKIASFDMWKLISDVINTVSKITTAQLDLV